MSGWHNPDHVAKLIEIWPLGLSSAQMAKELNRAFTDAAYSRNAVIGKLCRLDMRRERPAVSSAEGRRLAKEARGAIPKRPKSAPQPRIVRPAPVCEPVEINEPLTATCTILDLTHGMCKWPVGDPRAEDFGFCGRLTAATYCKRHAKLAYTAPSPKSPRTASELARALRRYIAA